MKVNARVVQERLGHSNMSITLALYGHVIPGMQEEVAGEIGKVLKISEKKTEPEEER